MQLNRLGRLGGLGGGRRVSAVAAFAVSNQTFGFGTKTLEGDGAWTFSAGTGTIASIGSLSGPNAAHFNASLNAGVVSITPSSTGDTADLSGGPYSLTLDCYDGAGQTGNMVTSTQTITTIANAYSVANATELDTAWSDGGLALGDQILGRTGNYNQAKADVRLSRTSAPTGTWSGSNYVVFKPHTSATVNLWRLGLDGNTGSGLVQNFYLSIEDVVFTSEEDASLLAILTAQNGASYIRVKSCTDSSSYNYTLGDPEFKGPSIILASAAGCSNIVAEDNEFTDHHYDGINISGDDCKILRNELRNWHNDAIKHTQDSANVHIKGNQIYDYKGIAKKYTVTGVTRGATTTVTVDDATGISAGEDGFLDSTDLSQDRQVQILSVSVNDVELDYDSTSDSDWVSGDLYYLTAHQDFWQMLPTASVTHDGIEIEANIFDAGDCSVFPNTGIPMAIQAQVNGSYTELTNFKHNGNRYVGISPNAPLLNKISGDVKNNQTVAPRGLTSGLTPTLVIKNSTSVNVENNIANNWDIGSLDNINSLTVTKGNNAEYDAVFTNPQPIQVAGVSTNWDIKTGSSADTADPKQGAHQDFTNFSTGVHTEQFDTTAPTLSNESYNVISDTQITGSIDTDEPNGTMYLCVTQSATSPSEAQLKAGEDHLGAAADYTATFNPATGSLTFSTTASGLTASTTYYFHWGHDDHAGNWSGVTSGTGQTTEAPSTTVEEVQFDASDDLDLSTTVGTDLTAWTLVFQARIKTLATEIHWSVGFDSYMQLRNTGVFRFKLEDTSTADLITGTTADTTTTYADEELVSVMIAADQSGMVVRINDVEEINETWSTANNIDFLYNLNEFGNTINIRGGVWAASSYLDPATYFGDFFDTANNDEPKGALLDGSAVNGVSPDFHVAGDAAVWNALTELTGTVTDV